ncbi:MAG TPA: TPM domain-containing protein [Spirochaetota bacterium]|nr:TPM domain-containing protein [Spirochaetota bacterium]
MNRFLSEDDRARITDAVKKAEKSTSGEIVPMVVSASDRYPLASVIGALGLSIPLALPGAWFLGPLAGMGRHDMWIFLGVETVLFLVAYLLVDNVLWLRRLFISEQEMMDEVRTAALASFYQNGLHRTRDETGVLIFISVFEKKVWVLGDRGIHGKVGDDSWKEIVSMITEGIKNRKQGDAICRAVERAGEILAKHFPIKAGDRDELPNLIEGK